MDNVNHLITLTADVLPEKTEYNIFKVNHTRLTAPLYLLEITTKTKGIEYEVIIKSMTFETFKKALDYATNQVNGLLNYHTPHLTKDKSS